MRRFWSILFFAVPILGVIATAMATFGISPLQTAWLPKSLSESGDTIDQLFNGIHILAAVILLGTGLTLAWALWKFDYRNDGGQTKAQYFHHNTKLEVIWTLIPAMILLFLAFFQMKSWSENKMNRPTIDVAGQLEFKPPTVLIRAKRFGWEVYYPGADGLVETEDDLYIENMLVLPVGVDVVMQLESRDVIHSFYVPELRLKQDIVPGMVQFAWFNAREACETEVLCTELCGWGHYKMKSALRLVSPSEFASFVESLAKEYVPELQTDVAATGVETDAVGDPPQVLLGQN